MEKIRYIVSVSLLYRFEYPDNRLDNMHTQCCLLSGTFMEKIRYIVSVSLLYRFFIGEKKGKKDTRDIRVFHFRFQSALRLCEYARDNCDMM